MSNKKAKVHLQPLTLLSLFVLTFLIVVTSILFSKSKSSTYSQNRAKAANANCTLSYAIPTPTPIVCNKNIDILGLSIDRSSSMNSLETDGRTKLAWAKEAAKSLVFALQRNNLTNIKVGINSFGAQGNYSQGATGKFYQTSPLKDSLLHIAPTNNFASVQSAIDSVVYISSGTCVECGLKLSNQQLTTAPTKKIAILLSDGQANSSWSGSTTNAKPNAIAEANYGRTLGITYHVIGYGKSGYIDETTLKAIAGTNGTYQYKPNSADWSSAFINAIISACNTP